MGNQRTLVLLAAALSAAGCASPMPGVSTEKELISMWGKPAEERAAPDGGRILEYPREPLGMENWRVTLDKGGTVRSVEQVVSQPFFAKLRPGMSEQEVRQMLGRESQTSSFPRLNEYVVSWLYEEPGNDRWFMNTHFDDVSKQLKYTTRTRDPNMGLDPGSIPF